MVLMAIDHVRDFFGPTPFFPEDVARTTPGWFFTRWVTHFCAPVFVFLAGTGAYLYGLRGRTKREVSRFLFTRGLWLVAVELLLLNPSWLLEIWLAGFALGFVQVIWAIGCSMIVLSFLLHLPLPVVAGIGLLLVGGHNLLDGVAVSQDPASMSVGERVWVLLHGGALWIQVPPGVRLAVRYPLLPWLGVLLSGYAFGNLFTVDAARRRRFSLAIGLGATALFVALRASNAYGDPRPWSPQERGAVYSFLSFLNGEKYPPSLLFLLMTLGPAIASLPLLERGLGPLGRPIVVFGRVPFFYYVIHVPLIHAAAAAHALLAGRAIGWWNMIQGLPEGYEPSLALVYGVFLAVVIALYPLCLGFAGLKRRSGAWWLRYL